jgi:cell division protein ZapA
MDLARDLDGRIEGLRAKFGEIGDLRLTVMAALTVVDEVAEMTTRVKRLEQELAAAHDAQVAATTRDKVVQAAVAAALTSAAERVESVAKKLNESVGGGAVGGVALG